MNNNPDMDPTGHMPAGPDKPYRPNLPPLPVMKDREYHLLITTDGSYDFQVEFNDFINKGWIPFPESLNTTYSFNGNCYPIHSILFWREKK